MNQDTSQLPLPVPELVAALANQYIELVRSGVDERLAIERACDLIAGAFEAESERCRSMCEAARSLAAALGYPAPYVVVVTMVDGSTTEPQRHTITHFVDGEGYEHEDWACIAALTDGEVYVKQGKQAVLTVARRDQGATLNGGLLLAQAH